MKLGFNAQLFLKGNKTGIAWYAENIIKELLKDSNNQYQCDFFSLHYDKDKIAEVEKFKEQGASMNPCIWFHDVLYKLIWPFVPIPYHCFFGKKVDITLFFNYAVPPGVKGKKIVCVYDMAYRVYPETVRKKTRRWLELILKKSCKRADAIVTISEFSKQQIIRFLNIEADKIWIVPCGVDTKFHHPQYEIQDIERIKKKYGIDKEYFLYLGTLEPRKNIERLIKAYKQLLNSNIKEKQDYPILVIAGSKGWMYQTIFQLVKDLNLDKDIIFTGYVLEEEKPILMKEAKVFVFPSLYEGFGMPPLEAMACGTPVLTSNNSSLLEVVGDAGVLVNPESITEICDGMKLLLQDSEAYDRLVKAGKIRSKEFTWAQSAMKLKEVYQELLKTK